MCYEVICAFTCGIVLQKQEHRISKLLEWSGDVCQETSGRTGKTSRGWWVQSDNLGASNGLGGRAGGWWERGAACSFMEPSSSASLGPVGQKSLPQPGAGGSRKAAAGGHQKPDGERDGAVSHPCAETLGLRGPKRVPVPVPDREPSSPG